MIRVRRGPEPQVLKAARRRQRAAAIRAWAGDQKPELTGYNLDEVRDALYAAQGQKCVYCERDMGKAGQPVEHFRPKDGAEDRHQGKWLAEPGPYWWLTFFERTAPYQAAAYCALLRWVPEEQRLRWALAPLERPGVVGMSSDESVDQSIDLPEAALYEQLPIEVQLELQAAGGQPGYLVQKVQSCCPLAAPEDIAALLGIQGQRVRTLLAAVAQADDEGA